MKKKESISANRIVGVDVGKLSQGLALTFSGVTKVFESLGADQIPGFGTVSADEPEKVGADEDAKAVETTVANEAANSAEPVAETSDQAVPEASSSKKEAPSTADKTSATETAENVTADTAEPANDEKEAAEPEKKATAEEAETADKTVESAEEGSAFTLNDIMKIASTKMAKDSSVTEKIGSLVKTYGVATLKELPESKFEAFMTDLTQI